MVDAVIGQVRDGSAAVLFWAVCLVILVIILCAATLFWRRRLSPNEDFHGEGFTLSDLRRMHAEGKMSDAEFERTKAVLLATLAQKTAKPADSLSDSSKPRAR